MQVNNAASLLFSLSLLRNRNLLVVLLSIVLMEVVHGVEVIALLPSYFRQEVGLSVGFIGVIISTYMLADVITRTPAGWLVDRLGRKPILLLGVLISAVVIPPMMLTGDPVLLVILNVFNGVGAGCIWPSIYASVADSFESERRGVVLAVLNMVMLGGLASGPVTGNFLIGFTSYRTTFAACLVLVLLVAAIVGFGMRETLGIGTGDADERRFHLSWLDPSIVLLGAMVLAITGGLGTLLPVIELYGQEILRVGKTQLGLILLAPGLFTAAVLIPAGHLADRLGRKGPLVCGTALMGACLWASPLSTDPLLVSLGGMVAGLGYALVTPSWNALAMDKIPRESRGLLLGGVAALQGAGLALGPLAGGFLWEFVHPFAPFMASAGLLSVAAVLGLTVKE